MLPSSSSCTTTAPRHMANGFVFCNNFKPARDLQSIGRCNQHHRRATRRYHSFYSPTGIFMIRHGDYKLIQFGTDKVFSSQFPDQLFNLKDDPHVRALFIQFCHLPNADQSKLNIAVCHTLTGAAKHCPGKSIDCGLAQVAACSRGGCRGGRQDVQGLQSSAVRAILLHSLYVSAQCL
mgnify:FL=1